MTGKYDDELSFFDATVQVLALLIGGFALSPMLAIVFIFYGAVEFIKGLRGIGVTGHWLAIGVCGGLYWLLPHATR